MPKESQEKKSIQISLRDISILASSYNLAKAKISSKNTIENLSFDITPEISHDIKNSIIAIIIRIVLSQINSTKEQILRIDVGTAFNVANVPVIDEKKPAYSVPDQVLANLISIAIGNARGILALQTKGTPLQATFLPILDAMQFVKKLSKTP